jgi:predicted naringenin-chalcone synthase
MIFASGPAPFIIEKSMRLHAIASANPPHHFTQTECFTAMQEAEWFSTLSPTAAKLLEKILTQGNSGIQQRHFALDRIADVFQRDAQSLNEHFEKEAAILASAALERALQAGACAPHEIDALIICTCTGYLCPGVTSHVAEKIGLRSDTYLMDLVGLGCGAAIPALRAAQGYLHTHPEATVAVIAVEICSSAFHVDADPGVLISLCLFADGASASLWRGAQAAAGTDWRASAFRTTHLPEHREKIRFVNHQGRLRNQLHKSVPTLAAQATRHLYDQRTTDPDQVLAHSGGRDVIDALEATLPYTLDETRHVLSHYGNMSSPSVLFALEQRLNTHPQDKNWWLVSFGAGFAAHSLELSRGS